MQAWTPNPARRLRTEQDAFFPDPDGVTPEYVDYCRWRFTQRVASSALSVLATQQMLFAVGLGAKRALPTAAALNWVLKDGLGRLGELTTHDASPRPTAHNSPCTRPLPSPGE